MLPDIPVGPSVGEFLDRLSAVLEAAGFTFVAHPRAFNTQPISQVWKAITPAAVVSFDQFSDQDLAAAGHRHLGYAFPADLRMATSPIPDWAAPDRRA